MVLVRPRLALGSKWRDRELCSDGPRVGPRIRAPIHGPRGTWRPGTRAALGARVGRAGDPTARSASLTVQAEAPRIDASIPSRLQMTANVAPTTSALNPSDTQSVGEQLTFHVTPRKTYTFTKYV